MQKKMRKNAAEFLDNPWKGTNEIKRRLCYPMVRLIFAVNGVSWKKGWKLYGTPILKKHRRSAIKIGDFLQLRSSVSSNPLAPNHPVTLCTWQSGAKLEIGDQFAMTGGVICAANRISIGCKVVVGANCTIMDTDFHPLDPALRSEKPQSAQTAPIIIEDEVFIGLNCIVLKGVKIGRGSTVGAGSVVTTNVQSGAIVAGNPAMPVKAPINGQS